LRTEPNLLDLAVAIAAAIAAAMATTRREVADTLPGVAIAVALVPPLCVSGISLALHEWDAFFGSLLLFGINLFAIILCASIVFLVSGFGSWKSASLGIIMTLVVLTLLSPSLFNSLKRLEYLDASQRIVETWLQQNYPHNVNIHPADLNQFKLSIQPQHIFIYMEMNSDANGLSKQQVKKFTI